MRIYSRQFAYAGHIPQKYTCEGEDISPPLIWEAIPADARTLALIMEDPDAPDPENPERTWSHWVVHNIPAKVCFLPDKEPGCGLPEGASGKDMPEGAVEGYNDWERTGYGGPCPPVGLHRYYFRLYALDTELPSEPMTREQLLEAMEGHIIDKAELMGVYRKTEKKKFAA
jgi:Raf kinase inhibitor-like YbhB/YbcL family protein